MKRSALLPDIHRVPVTENHETGLLGDLVIYVADSGAVTAETRYWYREVDVHAYRDDMNARIILVVGVE